MNRNPYAALVPKNASDDDIKKAYRTSHASTTWTATPGTTAPRSGSRRQGAYDVLSDPEKRKAYDTFGEAGARGFLAALAPT